MTWTDEEPTSASRLYEVDPYGVVLLEELLDRIEIEIGLAKKAEVPTDVWAFVLLTLDRSLTAGRQALRLLASGHPWLSLYLSRLLLEGYVAVMWAIAHPGAADGHFRDFRARRDSARTLADLGAGEWPRHGDMANDLDDEEDHQAILLRIRKLQNRLSSHAVSDYALEFAIETVDGGDIRPAEGPTQRGDLLAEGLQHLVWLGGAILLAAANVRRSLREDSDGAETQALIDEVLTWTAYSEPTMMRRSEGSRSDT